MCRELCSSCPSGCGPFRHSVTMFESVENRYNQFDETSLGVFDFMGTTAFATMLVFALLTCFCYTHAKSRSRLARATKLQVERDMERLDKLWILSRYKIKFDEGEQFDSYAEGATPAYLSASRAHEMKGEQLTPLTKRRQMGGQGSPNIRRRESFNNVML